MSTSEQQVWMITGAGRGLGVELAKAALEAGHAVVATGRNPDTVTEAIGEHDDLLVVALDVNSADAAAAAVSATVERVSSAARPRSSSPASSAPSCSPLNR